MQFYQSLGCGLPSRRTWRPWTLRRRFLIFFIFLCIILIALIETATRACEETGCHVFGNYDDAKISPITSFAYNQLPTVVGILIGLVWVLPHHDIMRLEPYFRMSKAEGATAKESLFLDYPYTFALFVPIKALWRKHFVILLSSSILMLMNFGVTPLISAIFEVGVLSKPMTGSFTRASARATNDYELTTRFAYMAYDHTWLGGPLPPFTTDNYALLPVSPAANMTIRNETWTMETTLYGAEMKCQDAEVIYSNDTLDLVGPQGQKAIFCNAEEWIWGLTTWIYSCDKYTTFRMPWSFLMSEVEAEEDGALPSYFFAWGKGANASGWPEDDWSFRRPSKLTAIYCTVDYYSEDVVAQVAMPAGVVKKVEPKEGTRAPFRNLANFGQVISGDLVAEVPKEYKDTGGYVVKFGPPPQPLPDVESRLIERFGQGSGTTLDNDWGSKSGVYTHKELGLQSFALYGQKNETLEQLLDPTVLEKTLEETLKLWFAVAVTSEMVDKGVTNVVEVDRRVLTRGFAASKLWARLTEAVLAGVVVLTAILTVLVGRRNCDLDGEPNSLAASLRLLNASPEFCSLMDNAEFHPPEEILKVLGNENSRYKLDPQEHGSRLQVIREDETKEGINKLDAPVPATPFEEPLWALTTLAMVGYLLCFALVTGLLVGSFVKSRIRDGLLTTDSVNSFGYKILFSYLPIAIGSTIEPAIVSLGTCYCMLGPYKPARRGSDQKSISLTVDYDRYPPFLQMMTSFHSRNLALAAIGIAIILSNVLTVVFASIFSSVPADTGTSENLKILTGFDGGAADEMYYVLGKSLEDNGTPLPTWVNEDYYVVPFSAPGREDKTYNGNTMGIGVDIQCTTLRPEDYSLMCDDDNTRTRNLTNCPVEEFPYLWNKVGINDPCWTFTTSAEEEDSWWGWSKQQGYQGWQHPSGDTIVRSATCKDTLFAIWVERPADPLARNASIPYKDEYDAVILRCKSSDKLINLAATMSNTKQVENVENVEPLTSAEVDSLYSQNPRLSLSTSFLDSLNRSVMHDARTQIPWMNYLMALKDPGIVRDLPTPGNVTHLPGPGAAKAFEDVYRQLFAIDLWLHADSILSKQKTDGVQLIADKQRVYVNSTEFYIAAAILVYIVVMLVWLYSRRKKQLVGHPPRSLVGMYAHLYTSNDAKQDCGELGEDRALWESKLAEKYMYGGFDRQRHVGVYRVDSPMGGA